MLRRLLWHSRKVWCFTCWNVECSTVVPDSTTSHTRLLQQYRQDVVRLQVFTWDLVFLYFTHSGCPRVTCCVQYAWPEGDNWLPSMLMSNRRQNIWNISLSLSLTLTQIDSVCLLSHITMWDQVLRGEDSNVIRSPIQRNNHNTTSTEGLKSDRTYAKFDTSISTPC